MTMPYPCAHSSDYYHPFLTLHKHDHRHGQSYLKNRYDVRPGVTTSSFFLADRNRTLHKTGTHNWYGNHTNEWNTQGSFLETLNFYYQLACSLAQCSSIVVGLLVFLLVSLVSAITGTFGFPWHKCEGFSPSLLFPSSTLATRRLDISSCLYYKQRKDME